MSIWTWTIVMVMCVVMIGLLGSVLIAGIGREIDEIRHPQKYDKWMHKSRRRHGHGG